MTSLAVVPLEQVNIAWDKIKQEKISGVNTTPIINYFEGTWVIGHYPPSEWTLQRMLKEKKLDLDSYIGKYAALNELEIVEIEDNDEANDLEMWASPVSEENPLLSPSSDEMTLSAIYEMK